MGVDLWLLPSARLAPSSRLPGHRQMSEFTAGREHAVKVGLEPGVGVGAGGGSVTPAETLCGELIVP